MTRVAIIVCAANHLETTTRPCLDSVAWFTDCAYRVLVVDNASQDGTAAHVAGLALDDPRVTVITADTNLGWAGGTALALGALEEADTHVCLLNSDTLATPRWLSRMLAHLEAHPELTGIVPNERPDLGRLLRRRRPGIADARAMVPGTRTAAPPPPLERILAWSGRVARRYAGRTRRAPPSGFCFLAARGRVALLLEYLRDFDRFRTGERDWQAWWQGHGASAHVALDVFVFHARGGSGGYYLYDGGRAP